jgi:hypothetical protein
MKNLIVVGLMVFLVVGSVYAGDQALSRHSGDYTVTLKTDRGNLIVGENNITIEITDKSGKAVNPDKVDIAYYMTEKMSATRKAVEMPHMHNTATVSAEGSAYKTTLNISMPGPWKIDVKMSSGNKATTAKFHVNVK